MVLKITSNVAKRNNEYQTGGNYPCLMIQTNRNRQIRDSNLNHRTDNPDSLSSLRTNNNGDSNLNHLMDNHHMVSLSSLLLNNNGDSNLLRVTPQHSMWLLLTVFSQPQVI